jgi:ArsR family transcriptional regulator, arsenate/arsenite/antimonite-responsive transcriptional repressor
MESKEAIKALGALAQDGRLTAFRLLVRAGREGVPAGDLARALGAPANTLSAQLAVLSNAGLVTSRRDGRLIIYSADYAAMGELLLYLMQDCCAGRAEVCAPIADAIACAAGCP